MTPIKTLPLVASLFLLGCQTTQWVNYGDPSANLDRDQYECKRDAYGMVRTPNAVAAPAPTIPSTYSTNCNMLGNSAYCSTQQTNGMAQAMIAQSNQQMAQSYAELGAAISRSNIMDECMRAKGWRKEAVEPTATASSRSSSGSTNTKFVPDFGSKGYSRSSPTGGGVTTPVKEQEKTTTVEFEPYERKFYQLDRRTAGAVTTDSEIAVAADSFASRLSGGQSDVSVLSFNRRVLLAGSVANTQDKQRLIDYVSRLRDVQLVIDQVQIGSARSIVSKSKDQIVLKGIKSEILGKDEEMSVVRGAVHNGVVYLMGIVSVRESDEITGIARRINAVQRVVPAFEIISESELAAVRKGIEAAKRPKNLTISSQDAVKMLLQLRKRRDSGEISADEYENQKDMLMKFI